MGIMSDGNNVAQAESGSGCMPSSNSMAEIGVLTSSKRKVHKCLSIEYYLRALSDEDGGSFNFLCLLSIVNSSPVTGSPHLYTF